jgi:hypothetical protein
MSYVDGWPEHCRLCVYAPARGIQLGSTVRVRTPALATALGSPAQTRAPNQRLRLSHRQGAQDGPK